MIDNVLIINENEIAILVGDIVFTYNVLNMDKLELFHDYDESGKFDSDNREALEFVLTKIEKDDESYTGEYVDASFDELAAEMVEWYKGVMCESE